MVKVQEIWNKWKLDKPFALPIGGWEDWRSETKSSYPIRYFLQETFPDKLYDGYMFFHRPIRDAYWWTMHRIHPKHRYHVLKPRTLKPNYHDPRTMVLHGAMECLVSYYDHAMDRVDFTWNEEWRHIHSEIIDIYKWWTIDYPNRETTYVDGNPLPEYPKLPEEWGFMGMFNDKYDDDPRRIEWSRIGAIHTKSEEDWDKKTEEMLIRLMKIRTGLWF